MKKLFTTALICAWTIRAWACINPVNIEGVAFTADEPLHLQVLMESGTEGVNYFCDTSEGVTGIRYMSHYDSRAMVFIGNYGMSYQSGLHVNCMGVILPLPDSADIYDPLEKEEFDFATAVVKELAWLAENNIISMSEETLSRIESALSRGNNGGNQYWTHADYVLGYNSWFNYDTTLNRWADIEGVDGVDGVNGVSGVWGLKGCSMVNPSVEVPPESFAATDIAHRATSGRHIGTTRQLRVTSLHNGRVTVSFPKADAVRNLTVFDIKGVTVHRQQLPAGSSSLTVNGLPRGMYFGQLQ